MKLPFDAPSPVKTGVMRKENIGALALVAGIALLCTIVMNAPGQEETAPEETMQSTEWMPAMHANMQVPPVAMLIQRERASAPEDNYLDPDGVLLEDEAQEEEEDAPHNAWISVDVDIEAFRAGLLGETNLG